MAVLALLAGIEVVAVVVALMLLAGMEPMHLVEMVEQGLLHQLQVRL
jgi:hypothetical protein